MQFLHYNSVYVHFIMLHAIFTHSHTCKHDTHALMNHLAHYRSTSTEWGTNHRPSDLAPEPQPNPTSPVKSNQPCMHLTDKVCCCLSPPISVVRFK